MASGIPYGSAVIVARSPSNPRNRSPSLDSSRSPTTQIQKRFDQEELNRKYGTAQAMDESAGSTPRYVEVPSLEASLGQYGFRAPLMQPQSTPIGYNYPSRHETFGSQLDYNHEWMPANVELPEIYETSEKLPSRYLDLNRNVSGLPGSANTNSSPSRRSPPRRQSIIQWFDRTVENELQKRRDGSHTIAEYVVNVDATSPHPGKNTTSTPAHYLITRASASGVDIQASLRAEQDNELSEAVDKLAKAEAICMFAGAVKAAEEAAAAAPPEYAEEAAAAGARGYQAELTGIVREHVPGLRPVEVIGYVGITRPKRPKKL